MKIQKPITSITPAHALAAQDTETARHNDRSPLSQSRQKLHTPDDPFRSPGAALVWHEEDRDAIESWLTGRGTTAKTFTKNEFNNLLQLIEAGAVYWAVTASVDHGITASHILRLLTALGRTDTDLWTANDDRCVTHNLFKPLHQHKTMRDAMKCREAIKTDVQTLVPLLETVHSLISDVHEVTVVRQLHRLASLSQKERDLYDAASEEQPRSAAELCKLTLHSLDSQAKTCLATLIKLGLLKRVKGRRGYLRAPTKS